MPLTTVSIMKDNDVNYNVASASLGIDTGALDESEIKGFIDTGATSGDDILVLENGESAAFIVPDDKTKDVNSVVTDEDIDADNKRDGEEEFRTRIVHTACIFLTMSVRGWRYGLVGPTFPDLRLLIDEDLTTASWIFTALEFGGLLGAGASGYFYDRFNKLHLLTVLNLGLSVSTVLTPWCTRFIWMMIMHVICGACIHALGSVCTTDIVHVWFGRTGSYIQATFLFYSIGAIISPFIASPFLSTKTATGLVLSMDGNGTVFINMTERIDSSLNITNTLEARNITNGTWVGSSDSKGVYTYGNTNIYVPYTISAILSFMASLSFVILNLRKRNVYTLRNEIHTPSVASDACKRAVVQDKTFSIGIQRLFVGFQAIFLLSFLVIEKTFCGYLTTYLINLGWDKANGAWINSLYWGCVATGRFSGVFIVKRVSTTRLIYVFIGITSLGFIGMTISTFVTSNVLIWISVGLAGFGMSIMVATSYSWLSENVMKISGKQTSFTFLVANIGTMSFPVFTGYIMNNAGYEWFVYLVLIITFVLFLVFTVMVGAYKCVKSSQMKDVS